jgi:multiple sugar transport system substrate-binding protein
VLVLDDPELAEVIQREWEARSESECEITSQSSEVLLTTVAPKLEADVVIFPSAMLGQLAEEKRIRPLPKKLIDEPAYKKLEIFDLIRRREMQWKGKPYAASFGSPPLVLLARSDMVSEDNALETWTELAARVKSMVGPEFETVHSIAPLVQPLGPGWAGRILLVRAAPYIYHRSRVSTMFDFRTFEPRIDSPPFVKALEELVADYTAGPPEAIDFAPADVLDHFLTGKSAMAITWPSALPRDTGGATDGTLVEFSMRIKELPGATRRFEFGDQQWVDHDGRSPLRVTVLGVAGRMGAITRGARNVSLVTTFLGWATGPEQSGLISACSSATTLFRQSHVAQPDRWVDPRIPRDAARQYVDIVKTSLGRAETMNLLRLPAQNRYMAVLDEAVRKTLRGELSASEALEKAAGRWKNISLELGHDKQLGAYRHSLGIPVE